MLVENRGKVVSKDEILNRVWSDSFVEEANLSHHISRLRKALGESETQRFIETVPKRGYRFVHQVNGSVGPQPLSRFQNPRRTYLFGAAILTLLAIFIFLISLWLSRPARSGDDKIQSLKPSGQNSMSISRITNSGKVGAATISPDGKFIAYIQNHFDGEGTIYVRQTDTSNEVKLLEPADRTFGGTAFSADSKFIYYVVFDKNDPDGALYRISVLGGLPIRLLGNFPSMFTLSPDGTRVCFYRFDEEQKKRSLMIASMDGSSEEAVIDRSYNETNFTGIPAWSPDGEKIAFGTYDDKTSSSAEAKLMTIDLKNREIRSLTDEVWSEVGKMNWMPDGSGLVFVATRPRIGLQIYFLSYPSGQLQRISSELNSYGNYGMGVTADGTTLVADIWESSAQIWSVEADGKSKSVVQLTSGDSDGSNGLTSLPDGAIAYASRTGFDDDLWVLSQRSGVREGKAVTSDEFYEGEIAATPDGRYLVFASDRVGNRHLFGMNVDGSHIIQLTNGDGYEGRPDISPDGNWIVYSSWRNNEARILKMPITGGTPIELTDHESVAPSISPDGKFVACILPGSSQATHATLEIVSFDDGTVLNSFEVIPFDYDYRPARWTPTGDGLVFRKTDKNVGNLWKQRISGGEPQQFTDFKSDIIFAYTFSRDRKSLIVSRGKRTVNVIMMRNFRQF